MRTLLPTIALLLAAVAVAADQPGNKEEQLAKLRADFKSGDVEKRRAAVSGLSHSELANDLIDELRAALDDADGVVREWAATVLGTRGEKAVAAVPALIAQLGKDKVEKARETAARALGRIGKAVPTERRGLEALRKAAADDVDPVTRVVSAGALGMLDDDLPARIAQLRKGLSHEEGLVRMKSAHSLGLIGAAGKPASAEIVAALQKETDPHLRGYLARAVGQVGDPAGIPALRKELEKEKDPGVRGEISGSINRLGGKP